jgi:hypothetical protein
MSVKIRGDASLNVTVNLPHDTFEVHAKRVQRLLEQAGYEVYLMNGAFILQLAEQIREQQEDAQLAQDLMGHAARTNPNRS